MAQADEKCEREGGQLASITKGSETHELILNMYRSYFFVYEGSDTPMAMVRLVAEPAENCLTLTTSGTQTRRPCDAIGMPICKIEGSMGGLLAIFFLFAISGCGAQSRYLVASIVNMKEFCGPIKTWFSLPRTGCLRLCSK